MKETQAEKAVPKAMSWMKGSQKENLAGRYIWSGSHPAGLGPQLVMSVLNKVLFRPLRPSPGPLVSSPSRLLWGLCSNQPSNAAQSCNVLSCLMQVSPSFQMLPVLPRPSSDPVGGRGGSPYNTSRMRFLTNFTSVCLTSYHQWSFQHLRD